MDNIREDPGAERSVILSVRPEEFLLSAGEGEGIGAVVKDCVFLGLNTHYFVTLSSGEDAVIIQESSIENTLTPGTEIRLTINRQKLNVFDEGSGKNLVEGVRNDCPEA